MDTLAVSSGKDFTDHSSDSLLEPSEDPDSSLAEEPSSNINPPCRFFLEGRCHFGARCQNYHPGDVGEVHHLKDLGPVHVPPLQLTEGKKPAMKTAEDVISRLLWDTQVPAEWFSIGYLDRFLGILEESFTSFSWEDLASVGPGVLAIPKHRIQYFKYRDRVVWDKVSRTDDVFGSTGGGKTILEVMKEEDARAKKELSGLPNSLQVEEGADGDSSKDEELNETSSGPKLTMALGKAGDNLELVEDISTNQEGNLVSKEKERVIVGSVKCEEFKHACAVGIENEPVAAKRENVDLEKGGRRSFSYPKERPTHFIAIPITSPEIWEAVKHFQEALCAVSSDYAPFCVPRATLHITLCLLHLETPEEIHKAMMALEELQAGFQRLLPPVLLLSFRNAESFNSRVLYLTPDPVPQLGALAQSLEDTFTKKDLTVICPPSKGKFHLTIVKVPPRKGMPQLPSGLAWAPTIEDLGVQAVESIGFYEVGKGKRTDNVYVSILKLDLYGGRGT
ncbi:leukocyte receptor cluster member 9 [Thamnophis elegans]|uniref:leukocyte receptor cluster member 9 n=1 Tax=Thamnophis elegans TaxID=35005 RepID=UPI001377314C|nr:leukocyte receptor cluster member 9 [Thamnophis elegans]XP_032093233.1 leukocyte receptor cluster member 9 [Thamnophis elegans]XP_032093234.1 leukocyte receptor cluster member 9 [Thamnophis elegans]